MSEDLLSTIYDSHYYANYCGNPYGRNESWLRFFDQIAENIIATINPETVLDAGCAWGFLVEALRNRGVAAWGVDISEYAISQVHESIKPYCRVGSLTEPLERQYDLIVSIEVLEHMPQDAARQAVANLCQFSEDFLISSTPFDYKEATHINVQPPAYWARLFALQGFFRDVDYDASYITVWATRFCKEKQQIPELVHQYERRFFYLWKENFDIRQTLLTQQHQISRLDTDRQELQQALDEIHQVLDEIHHSRAWAFISRLQHWRLKLAPLGSWRERLFHRLLGKRPSPASDVNSEDKE
jgi:hypothetical protein